MAYEKRWALHPPEAFTANGGSDGLITVASTKDFRVKQRVILRATGLDPKELEIKQIDSATNMYVGPIGGSIKKREDISDFTVALSASIEAQEQERSSVPEQEVERITYEEEPIVARRVIMVDELGNVYDDDNPFPTETTVTIPPISIDIDAKDGANIAISGHTNPIFDELSDTITTAAYEEIYAYTSTDDLCRISAIEVAVSTPSTVVVKIEGTAIRTKRSSALEKNLVFEFYEHRPLLSGEELTVEVKVDRKIWPSYDTFTALSGYIA